MVVALLLVGLVITVGMFAGRLMEGSVKETRVTMVESELARTARNLLNVAKAALRKDYDWTDCENADRNCNDRRSCPEGYFPLYSSDLNVDVENYEMNNVRTSLCISPVSQNEVRVIVKSEASGGEKVILGAKFRRIYKTEKIPLIYGGSFTVVEWGSYACSYYAEGGIPEGITKPNFTVILPQSTPQQYFRFSAEIYQPENPAGNNPKNVRFFTNFSTEVSGYKTIDGLWTNGNVTLKNGAYVQYVEATGRIIKEGGDCGVCIENSDFQFPSLRTTLENNRVNLYSGDLLFLFCDNGRTYEIPPGSYSGIYLFGRNASCTLRINGTIYTNSLVFVDFFSENLVVNVKVSGTEGIYVNNIGGASRNTIRINTEEPLRIVGDTLYTLNEASVECLPINRCLFDFNEVYNGAVVLSHRRNRYSVLGVTRGGKITGTVLARKIYTAYRSVQIGNVFGETVMVAPETYLCNAVDSEGNQILPDVSLGFFDIVSSDPFFYEPILQTLYLTVCTDVSDCIDKLR